MFVNSSRTMKPPITMSGPVHPSNAARLTRIGAPAPKTAPTYGMKRSAAPNAPHMYAYGTPMKYSPMPATVP